MQYFIQYHNADSLGYFPFTDVSDLADISFDSIVRNDLSFFTRKSMVQDARGCQCFILVGTGPSPKSYFIWAKLIINQVMSDGDLYTASGRGAILHRPKLLNDLPHFSEFREFCGNFGIGFQNISKHPFCEILKAQTKDIDFI